MFSPCFWFSWKVGYLLCPGATVSFTSKPALRGCDRQGWSLNGKQRSNSFPPASRECLFLSFSPGLSQRESWRGRMLCPWSRLYENHLSERNFNHRVFSPVTASPMTGLQPCTAPLEEHRRRLLSPPRGGGWGNCESSDVMSHLLQYLSLISWQECERWHTDCAAYLEIL